MIAGKKGSSKAEKYNILCLFLCKETYVKYNRGNILLILIPGQQSVSCQIPAHMLLLCWKNIPLSKAVNDPFSEESACWPHPAGSWTPGAELCQKVLKIHEILSFMLFFSI